MRDATRIIGKRVANGALFGSNAVTKSLNACIDTRNRVIDEVTFVKSHAVGSTRIEKKRNGISIKNHMIIGQSAGASSKSDSVMGQMDMVQMGQKDLWFELGTTSMPAPVALLA